MIQLGLWPRLPAQAIAPLREARVIDGEERDRALRFAPRSGAAEPLGWLVANRHIRAAAFAAARSRALVHLHGDAQVAALQLDALRAGVRLADGRRFDAALVVAADSRFSPTRRLAGIGASMRDFGRSVVLACVEHERPHDGIAWECFRHGNTLALLPMSGRRSSVVLTVAGDAAAEWLALPDAAFAARIDAQTAGRLGRLALVGTRHHYPLVGVHAQRFVARRLALIGDAAVGMHPVTAQGWNLGLHGVEALARELAAARDAGRDIADPAALAAFERVHWRRTWPLYAGTNAVVSLFTDERPLARIARRLVLDASEQLPLFSTLVKSFVARQLTEGGALAAREPLPAPRERLP